MLSLKKLLEILCNSYYTLTKLTKEGAMEQGQIILAAMAASEGAIHTPVQIQKLLFLIDKKLSTELGGPFFDFTPYNYGPFDRRIYDLLSTLHLRGDVEIIPNPALSWRQYRLTSEGQISGKQILESLKPEIADYIRKLSDFVRGLSFTELVAVIYQHFPEMKANSVFQD